jgi:hypothetical protein
LQLTDVDMDGRIEIALLFSGEILIFDCKGKLLKRIKPVREYLPDFCAINVPGQEPYLLASAKRSTIHTLDGKLVKELLPQHLPFPQTAVVRFNRDTKPYLAVLSALLYQGNRQVGFEKSCSELHVFDPDWKLVYHEVLEQRCRAMTAVPSENKDEERLLIGGDGKVFQYELAKILGGIEGCIRRDVLCENSLPTLPAAPG